MADIKQIDKYKIVSVVGRGGMGIVYKAFDTIIKRPVAVKIMTDTNFDQETARKRFFREAQAALRPEKRGPTDDQVPGPQALAG